MNWYVEDGHTVRRSRISEKPPWFHAEADAIDLIPQMFDATNVFDDYFRETYTGGQVFHKEHDLSIFDSRLPVPGEKLGTIVGAAYLQIRS